MPKPTLYALVVEDDDENFARYRNFLDPLGFVVHRATSFPEARDKLAAHPFVLQFLDLDMNGSGTLFGINHLRWMHNNKTLVPTIIVSIDADLIQAAEAQKAYDFVKLRVYSPDFEHKFSELNAVIQVVLDRSTVEESPDGPGGDPFPDENEDHGPKKPDPPTGGEILRALLTSAAVLLGVLATWTYAPDSLRQPPLSWLFAFIAAVALLAPLVKVFQREGVNSAVDLLKRLLGLGKDQTKDEDHQKKGDKSD